MRRLLFLAYHFPPLGGGGVQRAAKFVRHLPSLGYEPIVVTGSGGASDRWTPSDASLADEIGEQIEVLRVSGVEPPVAQPGWSGRLTRVLDLKSKYTKWWIDGAIEIGRRVPDIDLIFGELIPYTTAYAASRLSSELGIPWIADLQDPWALDEMSLYPSAVHQRLDQRRMQRLLGTASAIIMNTPEATDRVRRRFADLAPKLVGAIPNGWDQEDFTRPAPARNPDVFRIVHAGYLHTASGYELRRSRTRRRILGGMPYPGVDFLPRSHVFLLEAIDRLIAAEPGLAEVIEVHLAGVTSELDQAIAARSPVSRLPGYLPHDATVDLMRSADLLFLPMHDLPNGTRAGLVPGKAYDYLGAKRPILAAIPDGDARDILEAAGNATICRPADVTCLAAAIRGEVERWQLGTQRAEPDPDVAGRYERYELSRRLAETLNMIRRAS